MEKLKDIPKLLDQIVIPDTIYQEYTNKFGKPIDKPDDIIKEEVKIEEKVKKSVRKKINVDFGDDDEDLF